MIIQALNRLLTHDEPTRLKLAEFSGASVRFDFTPLVEDAQINPRGFFTEYSAPPTSPFDLKIAFPLTSTPLAALGKERLLREARIEGNIGLGNVINTLTERLPLALEKEAENVVGPIIAQGLSQAGERAVKLFSALHESITRNVSKQLKQPDGPVPAAQDVRNWAYQVNAAVLRVEALSQRIARLERDTSSRERSQ
jgi:ubiquinone biosynthesis protein UbiJ